jgi:membrane peptidoglycan carboxypeptidase
VSHIESETRPQSSISSLPARWRDGWQRAQSRPWVRRTTPVAGIALLVTLATYEMSSSQLQSVAIGALAGQLRYNVEAGPSPAIRFPGAGPYDLRLGYAQMPDFLDRLNGQGYTITEQARMSPQMLTVSNRGLFTTYREKSQAGLDVRDCRGEMLFSARFPQRVYGEFDTVPRLLVDALLFIENRELLDTEHPTRNPALEWDRLGKAVLEKAATVVTSGQRSPGGSTLATQIEKYRHSPEGRTEGMGDKLRQMASASLRAYVDGRDTLAWRQKLVVDYLNTVPLSARPGFGEVNGMGDGLWAWYGRDIGEINRLLRLPVADDRPLTLDPKRFSAKAFKQAVINQQALAFKQALSLMVAQRRPSYYLQDGHDDLVELTDRYIRIMANAGILPNALRDAALAAKLEKTSQNGVDAVASFVDRKASTTVRNKLGGMLKVARTYDVDRLDLVAATNLDGDVQAAATKLLRSLNDPGFAKASGLYGEHLLREGDDPSKLMVSFTLFERTPGGNLLRVQTDNLDQPFDLNEGTKLDLGSTAKFRTLVTYLEQVAEMHKLWSGLDAKALAAVRVSSKDQLGLWGKGWLQDNKDAKARSLRAMLDAAMMRTYSANPGEAFFTGGGLHHFENFDKEDNGKVMNVRDALRQSVNLVFVRLMRDVVYHVVYKKPEITAVATGDISDEQRSAYLKRFADAEGKQFMAGFWRKYREMKPAERHDALLGSFKTRSPARLAAYYMALKPKATVEEMSAFIAARLPDAKLTPKGAQSLHDQYRRLGFAERAGVAGVNPMEMWIVAWQDEHPEGNLGEALAASTELRQQAYGWLMRPSMRGGQDSRIRVMAEQDAFAEIQKSWARLGYPFDTLTASYATSLGASGDRPAALAELMGIIINNGVRMPLNRIGALQFASNTPYETRLQQQGGKGERVLDAEIATVARDALFNVVENGTARRLKGVLKLKDGSVVPIGGKTGTGDHRFEVFAKGGALVSSHVVSRSGTFMFMIGERYFGTMMVYVGEPYAEKYKFTSAMPTQLLKTLAPTLIPMLEGRDCASAAREGLPKPPAPMVRAQPNPPALPSQALARQVVMTAALKTSPTETIGPVANPVDTNPMADAPLSAGGLSNASLTSTRQSGNATTAAMSQR